MLMIVERSTSPLPPLSRDSRRVLISSASLSVFTGIDPVDSGVDTDGMRAWAVSRPDLKFVLLGSRSSPRWNAVADS